MAFTGRDKKWLRGPRAVGLVAAGAAVVLGLATGGTVTQAAPAKPKPTHTQIQLLAINDFHGNLALNPATSSSGNVNGTPGRRRGVPGDPAGPAARRRRRRRGRTPPRSPRVT